MTTPKLLLCLLLPATAHLSPAVAQDVVAATLARMDQAAASFRGMSADVKMVQYLKLLDDKSEQTGTIQMQRPKAGEIRAILEFPGEQTLAFASKTVTIYYPKISEYQTYPAQTLTSALNQFLLLGFGSSGKELQKSYNITGDGTEKVRDKNTVKLVLTPKDSKVAQKLPKAELWIPDDAGYPVQQQFWEAVSGNYRLLTYSNIKINPPMAKTLEFKPPAGSKKKS